MEIVNGNDAPLTGAAPQLYITPQHIVFEQQPGRHYSLIYGQERAEAAQYDFGRRVDAKQMTAAVPGKLDRKKRTPIGWTRARGPRRMICFCGW